jgi:hypothetical protein
MEQEHKHMPQDDGTQASRASAWTVSARGTSFVAKRPSITFSPSRLVSARGAQDDTTRRSRDRALDLAAVERGQQDHLDFRRPCAELQGPIQILDRPTIHAYPTAPVHRQHVREQIPPQLLTNPQDGVAS